MPRRKQLGNLPLWHSTLNNENSTHNTIRILKYLSIFIMCIDSSQIISNLTIQLLLNIFIFTFLLLPFIVNYAYFHTYCILSATSLAGMKSISISGSLLEATLMRSPRTRFVFFSKCCLGNMVDSGLFHQVVWVLCLFRFVDITVDAKNDHLRC